MRETSVDHAIRGKLATLYSSPALLPQKLDLIARRTLLLEVDERLYHQSSFLDDRMIDDRTSGFWTGLEALPPPVRQRSALWIFHIGHCGSTLLSRLLPALCPVLPVREPPPLRTLAETLRLLGDPLCRLRDVQWQQLFLTYVALYSRTYDERAIALIKPSSDCSNLIRPALDAHAGSRSILMHQSLETYLAAMLVGPDPRLDIEGHAVTRLMDLHAFLGDRETLRLYELKPVERVVVGWFAGVAGLHQALRACEGRVHALDFDVFVQDPASEILRLTRFIGMPANEDQVSAVVGGTLMKTYAKAPEYRFSPSDRASQLAENRRRSAAEIDAGLRWAESLVQRYEPLQEVVTAFPMTRPDG